MLKARVEQLERAVSLLSKRVEELTDLVTRPSIRKSKHSELIEELGKLEVNGTKFLQVDSPSDIDTTRNAAQTAAKKTGFTFKTMATNDGVMFVRVA